jgi:hypothetical protein
MGRTSIVPSGPLTNAQKQARHRARAKAALMSAKAGGFPRQDLAKQAAQLFKMMTPDQREEFADEILQAVSGREGKRFALCLFRNITMFWCSLSGRDKHNFKEARDELGWAFDLPAQDKPARSCPVTTKVTGR